VWGVTVRPSRIVAFLIVCAAPLPILNCQSVVLGTMNAPARLGAYERRADIAYGTHARHRLDVYVPSNPHRAHPIVIFWYGGAWLRGEKGQYRFVAAALAKSGYVAVLPDYRTYPEGVFPQFNDDGALAVRWVHEHAAELGGDRDAIFLMGHSAGAHLAASLALDKRYLVAVGGDPRWIRGLIGLSGPYALEPPPWPMWKIVFPEPYTADDWQPLRHASRDAPPTLLLYGGDDWAMARDQAEALAKTLRSLNVPITAHRYPNTSHFGTVAALSLPSFLGAPVIDDVNLFIAETLAARR
jgi:acetyl esterase/lipase